MPATHGMGSDERRSAQLRRPVNISQIDDLQTEWNMLCVERTHKYTRKHIIQICSGITSGRVFNGKLYAQILQTLSYLHLLTGCFLKIYLQLSEQNFQETACKHRQTN